MASTHKAPMAPSAMPASLAVKEGIVAPKAWVKTIAIQTTRGPEFIDITEKVLDLVRSTAVTEGIVRVFSKHTTAAIKISENTPLIVRQMEEFLAQLASPDSYYRHNDFSIRTANITPDESPNGHSHCQHLLLGTSETIPMVCGELHLGPRQRIFLIELDHARLREVLVSVIGP